MSLSKKKIIKRRFKDKCGMKRRSIVFMVAVLSLGIVLAGCSAKKDVTDYSKAEHWMNIPTATSKTVDVFYL